MATEFIEEVEFEHSPIPADCMRMLLEETIKRDGQIWRVHKSDADLFPSNPHAHNIESGLTLCLSTGKLYMQRTDTGKSISKKDLEFVRLALKRIAPPPLLV
ncbi:MAG: hypothetical protein ACRESX_00115 [Gammaproteobacteria bacterium]